MYCTQGIYFPKIDHRDMDGHPQQNTKETW